MPRSSEPDDYLEPSFAEPFNNWQKKPTPENASTLLTAIHPVLTAALRTYGTQSPTMYSRAKIMALDAMSRYDPTQAKLRTHLMFQLQGLRRHAAKEQQILSVPEQVGLDLNHLRESENVLRDQLGRDPSTAELSEHTFLSPKRIEYIRAAHPSYSEGGQQRSTDEGEDIYSPAVQMEPNTANLVEMLYHDLSPVDQLIVEHTLGLHGKRLASNQTLARRLKISPGAVSQRKAKIQAQLDEFMRINPFEQR
jgi:DNA-directed RNA polymerase specialized sigma subunit